MASYSESEREMLRSTPIESILTAFGKDTRHGRDNKYYSPFRAETNPSFHVNPARNVWYDFGSGDSGSAVTLVCRLMNCSGGKAYDFLASMSGTFIASNSFDNHTSHIVAPARKIEILEVKNSITDQLEL